MEFKSFGLITPLVKALDKKGFNAPTPIQVKSIPIILKRRDLIGLAQTGTGKTAAFILPLISLLYEKERVGKFRKVKMLVLAPTRELALQIGEVAKFFASFANLKTCVVVGGVPIARQFKDLRKGSDIIIGTPGRIEDHLQKTTIDLSHIEFAVLDEADQMLDIGFLPSIKRILTVTPKDRQTLLFSATMSDQIKDLTTNFMKEPVEVGVSVASKPIEKIKQKIIMLDRLHKTDALKKIITNSSGSRVLVFVRTKHGADKIVKNLSKEGVNIDTIHGNKSQNQRQKALSNFKNGSCPALIATDIAARGIDVPGVKLVVNFDLPESPESYVHRIGRTARAGASGDAISFCSSSELKYLRAIEKLIKSNIPAFKSDGTPFKSTNLRESKSSEKNNAKVNNSSKQSKDSKDTRKNSIKYKRKNGAKKRKAKRF